MSLNFRLVSFLFLVGSISACSLFNKVNYTQDENGVYQAQKSTIPKSAVRLKGEVISGEWSDEYDRVVYTFRIIEVIAKGETFSTILPKKGEEVLLKGKEDDYLNDGNIIILDAMTPLAKESEMLEIVML